MAKPSSPALYGLELLSWKNTTTLKLQSCYRCVCVLPLSANRGGSCWISAGLWPSARTCLWHYSCEETEAGGQVLQVRRNVQDLYGAYEEPVGNLRLDWCLESEVKMLEIPWLTHIHYISGCRMTSADIRDFTLPQPLTVTSAPVIIILWKLLRSSNTVSFLLLPLSVIWSCAHPAGQRSGNRWVEQRERSWVSQWEMLESSGLLPFN